MADPHTTALRRAAGRDGLPSGLRWGGMGRDNDGAYVILLTPSGIVRKVRVTRRHLITMLVSIAGTLEWYDHQEGDVQ